MKKINAILMLCLLAGCINSGEISNEKEGSFTAEQKACMDLVIALDDSLGTIRNHACEEISPDLLDRF